MAKKKKTKLSKKRRLRNSAKSTKPKLAPVKDLVRIDRRKSKAVIKKAMDFDMTDILNRYIKDYGIPKRTAKIHERELKRFLVICALSGKKSIGMCGPIDKLWHTFIMFTLEYDKFCRTVAGKFIHHVPTIPGKKEKGSKKSLIRFYIHYREIFGQKPSTRYWPAAGKTKPLGVIVLDCSNDCYDCYDCVVPCKNPGPEPVPNCGNCGGTDPDPDPDGDEEDDKDTDNANG